MQREKIEVRKQYLSLIENEKVIGGRFTKARRIEEKGGNGNFSLVLTADDLETGKKVALKFFDPYEQASSDRLERFDREEKMLKLLANEPLVINAVGNGIGTLTKQLEDPISRIKIPLILRYFAMEWADDNFENCIYSKKMDSLTLLLYFKDMTKSIFRVHNKKICHRDLKPNNFLLLNNQIRLSDLGTAKEMDGTMPNIRSVYKTPVGDTRYWAPELIFSIGIADEFVYLSDVFALGAILFEMFSKTVLTTQIYTPKVFNNLLPAHQVLSKMDHRVRVETYLQIVKDMSKNIYLPDIDSYNDKVPKSIKNYLNELYKGLTNINLFKRMYNPISIHRKLDICIRILRNENAYNKWVEQRKKRRSNRLLKK